MEREGGGGIEVNSVTTSLSLCVPNIVSLGLGVCKR